MESQGIACSVCGKVFAEKPGKEFCSPKCRQKNHRSYTAMVRKFCREAIGMYLVEKSAESGYRGKEADHAN
jgi:phage FluMu protein Com